ncbi:hypothetical protein [Paludibaculum fermentans]|uniref:Glycosyltransferase RgtA/B/C/D-like domain-containing protein n=1 Tax=Paludibaculum fermentans TaxID=1473598 RepID=A0A7S7SJE4_PALFE|nr:hypothetical protein [Paludibaculum fermentans]QOY87144.1 hypothetical protein IRI77_30925 [Paludibaculum fermentans]
MSSHLYNAWLGTEILAGRADGLELASPTTNVLFDRILLQLTLMGGSSLAEHLSVPLAVLILFWGAVAWIRSASGSSEWTFLPCVAMLAYGWAFHNGLFNFYLSSGLAFWALALAWNPKPPKLAAAAALLAVAYVAHAIPVAWCCGVLAYVWIARRLPERYALWLPAAAIVAVLAGRVLIDLRYKTLSTFHQILEMSAIDQVWVFGPKYIAPATVLGMLWGFLLLRLLYTWPMKKFLGNVLVQLCAVMSIAILVAPTRVELGGYRMALSFITERMTLPFAVLICVMLSQVPPLKWQKIGLAAVAVLQFSFLYVDTRALNWWEDQVAAAVRPLPQGTRVVCSLHDWTSRTILWSHPLERPCIGHCYSYQNYEPGSLAFQVQAKAPNRIVMHDPVDTAYAGRGDYAVKSRDLPLYQVMPCPDGRLCAKPMVEGERIVASTLSMLPALW